MSPDPACYEERYGLTGHAGVGLAVGVISVGLGVVWQAPRFSAASVILAVPVIFSAFGVILAMPGVIAIARRTIAFRADTAGITLGTVPDNMPALRRPAVFIPWTDVERVVLYLAGPDGSRAGNCAQVTGIAVQRRVGTTDVTWADKFYPGFPWPTAASRPTRKITGWRLNRERLAEVRAAVAPAIPIVEARTQPSLDAD